MKITKENMIKMLENQIEAEKKNPYPPKGHTPDWNEGYIKALENILFTVSCNGE